MDRELEAHGQAQSLRGPLGDLHVGLEFLEEVGHVSDVVDALVEAAGELGRDGLDGHALVGEAREDHGQLRGALGALGLVHRDLGHEVVLARGAAPQLDHAAIGLRGLADGVEVALGGGAHRGLVELGGQPGRGRQARALPHESLDDRGIGGLADEVGDVEREEVAMGREAVHGGEADVVRVDMVGAVPSGLLDGGLGRRPLVGGLGPDEVMLPVALVPYDGDLHALLASLPEGGDLGRALPAEPVPRSYRVLLDGLHAANPFARLAPVMYRPLTRAPKE